MTLYFDLDAGIFVSGPGTRDRIDSLSFKRGDTCRIDLRFVSGITVQELAVGATGQIGLKESGQYDADFVAAATSWTKTGTGTSTVYSFDLNLATTELNALLGDDGTEGNDEESVALMFELEFVEDGVTTSSPTLTATVYNDVIKGDETGPTDITEGTPVNSSLAITGTLTDGSSPVVFPTLIHGGLYEGKNYWSDDGTIGAADGYQCYYTDGQWTLEKNVSSASTARWTSADAVAHPRLVSTWTPETAGGPDATGTPVITETVTSGRVGTMKVATGYLYIVCSATDGVPVWKKIALTTL